MAARPRRLRASCGARRALARAACTLLFLIAPVAAANAQAVAPPPAATPLANQRTPLPGIWTGGAPKSIDGIPAVAGLGVRTFVDLRAGAETAPEVRAAVEAAGMAYEPLPIAGEADLDLAAARALDALLDDPARYPLAIVCASGNRSGALLAVEGFWLDGRPAEEALGLGRSAGLTRLEPSVRLLLGLPPAAAPTAAPAAASAPSP